ncbi:uncharacterized protein LOC126899263 [Daktulosphaira vitifoliae]|uniref:uncharacterized protein LOC126899263 n=1 Tax=Daktulosphaira vitifoliae TaxID=58002 RepID=UPI0021AA2F19|nr:uncharacterized protein LOC126899263 [Daktulosphaira vitifoliae]
MKLFSLVFSSTVTFMIIHNDHYMSMSKATSTMSGVSNVEDQCVDCKRSMIPVKALYECQHMYCTDCSMVQRQNAYTCEINQCKIEDCKSKLPKGKCLKCNQMKTVDTLFLCRHKHCEDCIQFFIKSKISKCPIKECNAEVLIGMELRKCNYCRKDILRKHYYIGCYHPFCNECSAKFEKHEIPCLTCKEKERERKRKEKEIEMERKMKNEMLSYINHLRNREKVHDDNIFSYYI